MFFVFLRGAVHAKVSGRLKRRTKVAVLKESGGAGIQSGAVHAPTGQAAPTSEHRQYPGAYFTTTIFRPGLMSSTLLISAIFSSGTLKRFAISQTVSFSFTVYTING